MNPAQTFGPQVVTGNFVSDSWLYYVGPFLGAVLATILCESGSCPRLFDAGLVRNVRFRQNIESADVGLKHLDYDEVVANIDTDNTHRSQEVSTLAHSRVPLRHPPAQFMFPHISCPLIISFFSLRPGTADSLCSSHVRFQGNSWRQRRREGSSHGRHRRREQS